ncbi:sensor histidine kinase [Clostridium weizhouense]|uniref:histidine kinase n=1 Tax=Clostridium weizhouense TaxID=2859781 RepID=A0ABS7APZ6_9CLOT|nr:HAMP domain-containing sensor histidine kinase [Clostridium weizhouense]MBW6410736.1 HAMP domain-containing histidine kinase [Clostridium weizhouense]
MSVLNYVLITIIVILVILLVSLYQKLNYICKILDQILDGNLNQRIRFQNHVRLLKILSIKINKVVEKFQRLYEKNKIDEESRKRMISNISHDLRTPLTSMLGYMELILEESNFNDEALNLNNRLNETQLKNNTLNDEQILKYLKIVYSKGNYLYNLMEEFFQISKLDSNDIKLEMKKINISEIIRKNIISFFNEIKKLNIDPKINITEEDIYILSDEKALNRISSNLINNSLKHASKATEIGIDLNYDENNVFINIWDNGIGIPKEEIKYIFDRLYTVEKSRKLNLKSSGLGLTIVKKLVESLGGSISVSSVPFEKTVFRVILPRNFKKVS